MLTTLIHEKMKTKQMLKSFFVDLRMKKYRQVPSIKVLRPYHVAAAAVGVIKSP